MIIDINKSIVSIEKILKIEKDWEDKGFAKFPQNFDFKGAYMELLQWFDWDIKKYPYVDIDKDESENLYPENIHIKLEKDYSLVVLLAMVILYYCENEVSINNNNLKEIDAFITNACGSQYFVDRDSAKLYYYLEDNNLYRGDIASFVCGMIHNRMQNNDFEAFYKEFKFIIQKHILGNLADDSSVTTINTTATPVVEPKYIPVANTGTTVEQVKAKYGYVPAAYLALQCNPVGLWYEKNQYFSKFIDYSNKIFSPEHCYYSQDLINHITRVMSNRAVYEEILNHMPIIGTEFVNIKPVLLEFLGFSKTNSSYVLGARHNTHTFVIKANIKANKFETACGLNDDMNRIIDDYLNE